MAKLGIAADTNESGLMTKSPIAPLIQMPSLKAGKDHQN